MKAVSNQQLPSSPSPPPSRLEPILSKQREACNNKLPDAVAPKPGIAENPSNNTPKELIKDPLPSSSDAGIARQNNQMGFSREPPAEKIGFPDFREQWKLCKEIFPKWNLSEMIPCDKVGQKNKNAWMKKEEIPFFVILSFDDHEPSLRFLKNLSNAITLRLAPASVMSASLLEKNGGWEGLLNSPNLRLIIAGDYGIYCQPKLMRHYKEMPNLGRHFLNKTPLLLLSDPSLYLKEPQLKPLLWRAICNEFAAFSMKPVSSNE